MLKPQQMSRVIITGPKNLQEQVVKELHSLKILHIADHSRNEMADIGTPLESADRLSQALVKIRSLMSALGIKKNGNGLEHRKGLPEIEMASRKLSEQLNTNLDESKKIDDKVSKLNAAAQELEILKSLNLPPEALDSYKSLASFTGYVRDKTSVESIRAELIRITDKFMLLSGDVSGKTFIGLFADEKEKHNALDILSKKGFSAFNFSNAQGMKGGAVANIQKTETEIKKLQKAKLDINEGVERLRETYKGFLLSADSYLEEQLEKAEAPLKFAATSSSFLIKGWIPENQLKASIDRLNMAARNKIYVHFEPAKKNDKVPVKLKNPKMVEPFEFFMGLYSMPSYRELDPTFFIFLSFPIFFGMMLGDVGYGVLSLMLFWAIKKKMPSAKSLLNVLMISSFISVLFGFFFGEFFGYEFMHPVISREHDMFSLMYLAIGFGIVHVNLGLIIGMVNEWKSHGMMHAVYAKLSWIILEIGVALLALPYLKIITLSPLIGAIFLGLSILMLLKGEGVKGVIELPSIFTNILSYARLMAIGLSSVILAVIINDSARDFFHEGGFLIIAGVLILIVGHGINIMLGLLGSFLHSLRLHYVEFFSKFFQGGAKRYQPFGLKE